MKVTEDHVQGDDVEQFTAVLEVKDNGDWSPSAPITLKGADGETAWEVGIDFLAQRRPRGGFRLRVWPGKRADLFTAPAVTIGPRDVQRSAPPTKRVLRAGRRHHRTRVAGPASEVVERVRLDRVPLGSAILVTDDPSNTAASEGQGPWYPAAHTDGAVRATVKQFSHRFSGRDIVAVDFVLSVGEMRGLQPDRTVPRG